MPFTPLSQGFLAQSFDSVCLVASDMDGTLTQQGRFTASLLQALENLSEVGVAVLIVTGRSAGWVSSLAHYLPIWGAIAENGGLFFSRQQAEPEMLVAIPEVRQHRQKLADTFQRLQVHFPNLRESSDNRFRLTDWTFDIQGLSLSEIQAINAYCHDWGWGFTYSNVERYAIVSYFFPI